MTPAELIREEWRESQRASHAQADDVKDDDSGDDEFVDFDMVVETAVAEMEVDGWELMQRPTAE